MTVPSSDSSVLIGLSCATQGYLLNGESVETQIQKAKEEQPHVSRIEEWIRQVCDANQQSIDDYRQGKKRALSYLVGQVLKVSRGQADPALVQKKLQGRLNQEKEEAE